MVEGLGQSSAILRELLGCVQPLDAIAIGMAPFSGAVTRSGKLSTSIEALATRMPISISTIFRQPAY
ncbi:hypothetical protein A6X20_16320 [Bradyrhizobium elkanii]|nr:hypothetical protein A6452_39445 [Bradyrhizobium elkanii]ODM82703.1 hypothetical protein A6X20_16320 [Bradyrhizobium elkanii]